MPTDTVILAEVFEQGPRAIAVIDGALAISSANQAARALLGTASKALRLSPERVFRAALGDADGSGSWVGVSLGLERGSEVIAIDAKIRRLRDVKDKVLYAVTLHEVGDERFAFRGASESMRLVNERRAQAYAEQLKDQFMAAVSHELRTPLTSLLGTLTLIRSGRVCDVDDRAQHLLLRAIDSGDSLLSLVNDLLDFEQLQQGDFSIKLEDVETASVVRCAIAQLQGMAEMREVTVEDVLQPGIYVEGDPRRLQQAVVNLLSNAIKFSDSGSTVTISAAMSGTDAVIRVRDNGSGIPEELRPHIFRRFTRAQQTERGVTSGSGLGLAISKNIIDRMHGTIGFETELGKGSVFEIILPMIAAPGVPAADHLPRDEGFNAN